MEIVFAQEEAKQNKPHIVYRNLSSTHEASKPIKADVIRLSNLLSQFLLGAVGDTFAAGMPYEMLVPQDDRAPCSMRIATL